jgi:hypothetical protein
VYFIYEVHWEFVMGIASAMVLVTSVHRLKVYLLVFVLILNGKIYLLNIVLFMIK